jgi:glycosyltransferase involved in cell wall biosynthesis
MENDRASRLPRIALLGSRGIPARYGGFETFAQELSTRLVARGFEVTVFADGREGPTTREFQGVRVERVAVPVGGSLGTLIYDLRSLWRSRGRFDVVLMLGYGAGGFLWLARGGGTRVWIAMDGREWRRRKWGGLARAWLRAMERLALRQADQLVFDSAAVAAELAGATPPGAHVAVLAYGARLDQAEDPLVLGALGLAARRYCLLVARIEPENHVLEIVRAHARAGLARELVVVGDVERAGDYGRRCRAAGARTARFLGPLYEPLHLHTLRVNAWGILHGHSVGGTNPALLEGMAAAVPVVAHDNPYNREVLAGDGLWFGGEDELVERLRALEELAPDARLGLGERLLARVQSHYTWERIVDAYAAWLAPGVPAASMRGAARSGSDDVPAALPAPVRAHEEAR